MKKKLSLSEMCGGLALTTIYMKGWSAIYENLLESHTDLHQLLGDFSGNLAYNGLVGLYLVATIPLSVKIGKAIRNYYLKREAE